MSAAKLVEASVKAAVPATSNCPALPPLDHLARQVNVYRQKRRPAEPSKKNLKFEVSMFVMYFST